MKRTMTRFNILLLVMLSVASVLISSVGQLYAAPATLNNNGPAGPNTTPSDASVFFLRKQSNAGTQQDVKFSVYLPVGTNPGGTEMRLTPGTNAINNTNVCDVRGSVDNRYMSVAIMPHQQPGNTRQFFINTNNVCSQSNAINQQGVNGGNVFFARYSFPNISSVDNRINMIRFDVTISYGIPLVQVDGGIRMFATIPTNSNALVSPGTGSFAFPTIGDWELAENALNNVPNTLRAYDHKIPFGYCNPGGGTLATRVGLYDADNPASPGNTFWGHMLRFKVFDRTLNQYVQLGRNPDSNGDVLPGGTVFQPAVGTTNGEESYATLTVSRDHYYELQIEDIHVRNTIDIRLPTGSEAAYGVPAVCPGVPPPPVSDAVNVVSTATGGGDVELGGTVTFNQGVQISNFPTSPSQWGFNEEARRQAYNTNTAPVQSPYSANDAGLSGDNGTAERKCQNGWAPNCGTYICQNGGANASCANYRWRCTWTGGGNTRFKPADAQGNSGYGFIAGSAANPPDCRIFQYQCRDAAGNWQNQYKNFNNRENDPGCNQRWNCPPPSNEPNTFNPGFGPGYCRIFYCAYNTPADSFWRADGVNPDDSCDKRCNAGTGPRAPNWTGPGTDDNCYIQPSFTVTCTWQNNSASESYTVTNNGTYCGGVPLTLAANAVAPPLCAVTFASNSGWSSPPPGKGIDGDPSATRVNWGFNVVTPARSCARVGLRPYFHAYGGDVNAAASFGPSCTQNPTTIRAFNNGTTGNNVGQTYTGSGSQLGVFSRGPIDGFASKSQSATLPLALTFANTSGGWGGNWANNFCIPDNEWQQPDNTPTNVVSGGVISTKDSRYYGSDDVYITGNTSYPATYALANVPTLKLVTRGNVYISSAVTDFSGVIMTTGKIYTCAVDNGAGGLRTPTGAEMFANCSSQLRVRGSFVADQVKLLRTVGSVRYATPNPSTAVGNASAAELFFYTPETWMQSPVPTPGSQSRIESLINLPPVL